MSRAERGPRERIVFSAAQLIRRGGVSGTGLRDVVATAEAPWGSLQHYFPGGKDQIVDEALAWASGFAAGVVDKYVTTAPRPTPGGLFATMVNQWRSEFERQGYDRGCPLVAATADVVADNEALRASVSRGFATWQRPIAAGLRRMGVPRARATSLAVLMLASLEGAIVLARAQQDVAPLTTVLRELRPVLDAAVPPPDGSASLHRPAS
jgi:AcrR family transcriptional regulator